MKYNFWALLVRSGAVEGSGGGEAAPAPESSPQTPADRMGVSDEVKSVFDFDPFEPGEQAQVATPEALPGESDSVAGAVAAPPAPAPEVAPAAVSPPPEPPLAQTVQELRDVVGALPEAIRQSQPQPQPMQPQEDPWLPRDGDQPLNYMQVMSQIPDAVMHGIGSENLGERKQAVAQLMGISMTIAHRLATKQAVEQVRQEMSRILPSFVGEQIRSYDTAQQVYKDFYGAYPQLSAPHFRPIVMQEAQKLSRQLGVSGWTPQFRDQLGKHVLAMLGQVAPVTVQPAAPATQTMGPSARPAMANGAYNPGQDMADLLGI